MSEPTAGVWAVVDTDYGDSITAVHESELDALRSLNGRGYGRVRFVPFGKSLVDLDIEERAKPEPHRSLSTDPKSGGTA